MTCLVMLFEQLFLLFKQYNTYFYSTFLLTCYLNNIVKIILPNGSLYFEKKPSTYNSKNKLIDIKMTLI